MKERTNKREKKNETNRLNIIFYDTSALPIGLESRDSRPVAEHIPGLRESLLHALVIVEENGVEVAQPPVEDGSVLLRELEGRLAGVVGPEERQHPDERVVGWPGR